MNKSPWWAQRGVQGLWTFPRVALPSSTTLFLGICPSPGKNRRKREGGLTTQKDMGGMMFLVGCCYKSNMENEKNVVFPCKIRRNFGKKSI